MGDERSVYVVGDYPQITSRVTQLLKSTPIASIQKQEWSREKFLAEHRVHMTDLLARRSLFIFTFPRQERYLIYDEGDPVNTYYKEIHTVKEKGGIHVVCPGKLLILVFYNEETPDDSLFHKSLDRLWRLGGAQAAIKEFADSRRFFSIKEKFNDEQVKQICYQLDVEFKIQPTGNNRELTKIDSKTWEDETSKPDHRAGHPEKELSATVTQDTKPQNVTNKAPEPSKLLVEHTGDQTQQSASDILRTGATEYKQRTTGNNDRKQHEPGVPQQETRAPQPSGTSQDITQADDSMKQEKNLPPTDHRAEQELPSFVIPTLDTKTEPQGVPRNIPRNVSEPVLDQTGYNTQIDTDVPQGHKLGVQQPEETLPPVEDMEPQPNSMQTVESKIPLQERDESPGRERKPDESTATGPVRILISADCNDPTLMRKYFEDSLEEARQQERKYWEQRERLRAILQLPDAQLPPDKRKEVERDLATATRLENKLSTEKTDILLKVVDMFTKIDGLLQELTGLLSHQARDRNESTGSSWALTHTDGNTRQGKNSPTDYYTGHLRKDLPVPGTQYTEPQDTQNKARDPELLSVEYAEAKTQQAASKLHKTRATKGEQRAAVGNSQNKDFQQGMWTLKYDTKPQPVESKTKASSRKRARSMERKQPVKSNATVPALRLAPADCNDTMLTRKHQEKLLQEARDEENKYWERKESLEAKRQHPEAQLSSEEKKEVTRQLANAKHEYDRVWKEKTDILLEIVDKFTEVDEQLNGLTSLINQFRQAQDGN